ncbi:hypothetical protein RUM43_002475 [Polyplax serrata]|uniref:F5/8 type C domain-containing protein n=1 Tax=Polyplax serrata TaxID=468196 RepID=A0AAN8P2B3_POLSC
MISNLSLREALTFGKGSGWGGGGVKRGIHRLKYKSRECRTALGMEAGRIPDSAISASSSYEAKSVGPQNAR